MDISSRPTYCEASTQTAIDAARSFILRCQALVSDHPPHARLVQPVITPRFVPTCSDELMSALGALAAETGVMVQSHLAEAHDQVKWVQETRQKDDMDVFDEVSTPSLDSGSASLTRPRGLQHGLLNDRTVQAHCTFLRPDELQRMAARGSKIAHCPLSNAYFSAKPFPLREALQAGVEVGLGSDCAGGYSLDIMHAMRNAVATSRIREGERVLQAQSDAVNVAPISIDWKEALYLSTRGGAVALGLSSGVFEPGAPFDAQASE